jgi:hypothetical protein
MGSGFGVKNPAKPIIWAHFENGRIETDPDLSLGVLDSEFVSIVAGGQSGSSYAVMGADDQHTTRLFTDILANYPGSRQRYAYMFNKRKYDHPNYFGTNRNYKTHRLWPTEHTGAIDFVITLWVAGVNNYTWEGSADLTTEFSSAPPLLQQWFSEELEVDKGTLNTRNATFRYYRNGTLLGGNSTGQGITSVNPLLFGSMGIENNPSAGGMPQPVPPVYMDDFYADITWARVMVGNASTFSACTRREIQIPIAWSNSQITISVNKGGFSDLQNTFLYVIDSSGKANANGFHLGSVSSPPPPDAPSSLVVR